MARTRPGKQKSSSGSNPPAVSRGASGPLPWSWLQAALIALAGLWVFWPALHGGWIGDDIWYISTNPLLNDPARIWKAWFALGSWVEFYPIAEMVQWAQWQLWHNDTFGYHLTNVILHITSGLLVWRLFSKLGLKLAWLGGLIFVVHPMVVDSVALANELKASLSLPPFLLALCFWIDFEDTGRRSDYVRALLLFTVAMLCKITMAMFPVVILLFAWWKRGRLGWRDLVHTIPFFLVGMVLGILTIWAGQIYAYDPGAVARAPAHPSLNLADKGVLVGQTIAFYFSRSFLPLVPAPVYHKWPVDPSIAWQYLPYPVLLGVIGYLWTRRETWGRHALLGLGFFVIMLMPFLGFLQISYMEETWILEHLLYIPILGLIGLTVAGLEGISRQLPRPARAGGIGLIALAVVLLAWTSHGYASMFRSEGELSAYVTRCDPLSVGAHYSYGTTLVDSGHFTEALDQFAMAVQLMTHGGDAPRQDWNLARAYNNMAWPWPTSVATRRPNRKSSSLSKPTPGRRCSAKISAISTCSSGMFPVPSLRTGRPARAIPTRHDCISYLAPA